MPRTCIPAHCVETIAGGRQSHEVGALFTPWTHNRPPPCLLSNCTVQDFEPHVVQQEESFVAANVKFFLLKRECQRRGAIFVSSLCVMYHRCDKEVVGPKKCCINSARVMETRVLCRNGARLRIPNAKKEIRTSNIRNPADVRDVQQASAWHWCLGNDLDALPLTPPAWTQRESQHVRVSSQQRSVPDRVMV